MTQKLYYNIPIVTECDVKVLDCKKTRYGSIKCIF